MSPYYVGRSVLCCIIIIIIYLSIYLTPWSIVMIFLREQSVFPGLEMYVNGVSIFHL